MGKHKKTKSIEKICKRCGEKFNVKPSIAHLRTHCSKKCQYPNAEIIIGSKYGRLTILKELEPKITNYNGKPDKRKMVECLCECGKIKIIPYNGLRAGTTQSCGCLNIENKKNQKTHGHAVNNTHTGEYRAWSNMRTRCYSEKNKGYKYYGALGVKVCDRWLGIDGFNNFISDMGLKPTKKHSLDRINVKKGYYKENCKWSTRKEQDNNRTTTFYVEVNGERIAFRLALEQINFIFSDGQINSITYRIKKGMPFQDSVNRQIELINKRK